MKMMFPETTRSEAAEEGTACHWVASEALEGRGSEPFIGRTSPNGVVITQEIFDGAVEYVKSVRSVANNGQKLMVEQHVVIDRIHPDCHGTPDCWWYDAANRVIHLWDLKYGYGIVEPYQNSQLMCYAIGIVDLIIKGHIEQHTDVVMTIVQPRAFHVAGITRSWRINATDLRGFANRMSAAAQKALSGNPPCTSGNHCHYCSARHACPSAQKMALFAAEYTGVAVPEILTPEALAIELRTMRRAADAIKFRLSALEAQAMSIIDGGGTVPGWSLQTGAGRATWGVPSDQLFTIGDMMGVNLRKPPELITPVQAKKAGLSEELIKAYSSTGNGGLQLVQTDNTLAARAFAQG